MLANSIRY